MELTQQPAQQEAEPESFREAMFSAVRAQLQTPRPFTFAVSTDRAPAQQVRAQESFDAAISAIESGANRVEACPDLTPADVHAEVERIEREAREADSAYDKFKNSRAFNEARDAKAGLSFFEQQFILDHQR